MAINLKSQPAAFWITGAIWVVIAIVWRFLPHVPWTTSPIASLALFGASRGKSASLGMMLPFAAIFASDAIIEYLRPGFGFHAASLAVYGSYALIGCLGWAIRHFKAPALSIVGGLFGAAIFFIVTNVAHWLVFTPVSMHNAAGLGKVFFDAIPFANNLWADPLFAAAVFGTYALARGREPKLVTA